MSKLTVTCRNFKALRRNTLVGFVTVYIRELRLEIRDVAIHQKGEARWAQLPAKPMIDKNGVAIRDSSTGKIQYASILEFDRREVRDAFSRAVIAALLELVPGAFDAEENAA